MNNIKNNINIENYYNDNEDNEFEFLENAELTFYINNEPHTISLSKNQFLIIGKVLGLSFEDNEIRCFSEETLIKLSKMKGNPLKLQRIDNRIGKE